MAPDGVQMKLGEVSEVKCLSHGFCYALRCVRIAASCCRYQPESEGTTNRLHLHLVCSEIKRSWFLLVKGPRDELAFPKSAC